MVRSASRPTMGRSSRRTRPGATGLTLSSRHAPTGALLPFRVSGSSAVTSTASRTSAQVAWPSNTSPELATCSSRAATFTVSPSANAWAVAGSPASTSPVLTPVRNSSDTPWSRTSSVFSAVRAVCSSAAARTARRASSSRTTGMPNTAMTASPMNFSTVPPWRSNTARVRSKYRPMTSVRDSGSKRSPSPVEPARSLNTTVTTFRTRPASSSSRAIAAPQLEQNRAPTGLGTPQTTQARIPALSWLPLRGSNDWPTWAADWRRPDVVQRP